MEKTSDDVAYKSDYQAFEERRKLLGGRSIREGVSGGLVLSTSAAASKPTMPYTPTRNEMFGQEEYQTKKVSYIENFGSLPCIQNF